MMNDKDKDEILECTKELQSAMFRDEDPNILFKRLKSKYGTPTLELSMKLLEKSRLDIESPVNPIAECINRCMSKVDKNRMREVGKDSFNVDKFYELCIEGYKHFMNDEIGRALPIVFLYIKDNKKLGVLPIEVPSGENKSPMDYLKQIVYQENPDAYCFCGEASMHGIKEGDEPLSESGYRYGDIINDPSAKDIMIIQGNTKRGDNNINRVFDIITNKDGVLEFKEMEDLDSTNMECGKLP
jgi:hypothetical protein